VPAIVVVPVTFTTAVERATGSFDLGCMSGLTGTPGRMRAL
jgi:hypothetical protein